MTGISTDLLVCMMNNAVDALSVSESVMNRTNVFPVADGDTGTNMLHTLRMAVENSNNHAQYGLASYFKKLNNEMFLNCRGNSGNILAQVFRGFEAVITKDSEIDIPCFLKMIESANTNARGAVDNPKEGTILTMLSTLSHRLSLTEKIEECQVDEFLDILVRYSYHALLETRFQLYENRINGVQDSGARGLFEIFRAMSETVSPGKFSKSVDLDPDNNRQIEHIEEPEDMTDCFCLEFILHLDNPEKFSGSGFNEGLSDRGSSVVVLRNGDDIKVHIHTGNVESVSSYVSDFGRMEIVKIDDMRVQQRKTGNEYEILSGKIRKVIGEKTWNIIARKERKEILFCKMLKCLPYMDDRDYCLSVLAETGYKCFSIPGWQVFNTKEIKLNWSSLCEKISDHEEMVFLFLPDSGIWKKSEASILRDFDDVFRDLELKISYDCNVEEPIVVVFD